MAIARALVNEPELILADEPTGNLDSRTSVEIMEVLQRLNRERGLTVLLITHEPDIAEYAGRVVAFRDGRVVKDEPVAKRRDAADRAREPPSPRGDRVIHEYLNILRIAGKALERNKVRSALTALGRDHRRGFRDRHDRAQLGGPRRHRRAGAEHGHERGLRLRGELAADGQRARRHRVGADPHPRGRDGDPRPGAHGGPDHPGGARAAPRWWPGT